MTRTEVKLMQFIADHEGVIEAALRAYTDDMKETGDKHGLASFRQVFTESAAKAEKALADFKVLADFAEENL